MVEIESLVSRQEVTSLLPLLKRGEISLVRSRRDGRLKQVTVVGLVQAPPAKVWAVITDYAHYTRFMPSVEECEVTRRERNDVVVSYELEVPGVNMEYRLRHRHTPQSRIDIWLEDDDGDIQTGGWRWELWPHAGGSQTILLYHLYTDVRESSWILRQALETQPAMEHGLNVATGLVTVRAIKKQAEK